MSIVRLCRTRSVPFYVVLPSISHSISFFYRMSGGYQGASGVHGGKKLRRIRLKPIQQFWRRDQTVWSIVFDLPFAESTSVTESGIIFPTRVEDTIGKTNKNSKCKAVLLSCLSMLICLDRSFRSIYAF